VNNYIFAGLVDAYRDSHQIKKLLKN